MFDNSSNSVYLSSIENMGENDPLNNEKLRNPMLGKGRSGSTIVKLIHKQSKKEVAMKEINKKGKTTKEIDKIRHLIEMY